MSKNKKILMWLSAILMIVSGVVVGALCLVAIINPNIIENMAEKATATTPSKLESTRTIYHWLVSLVTAGSVVGIVFGGISIKFCTYSSIEFYQKKSVVLTVAIICTIVVNPLVGALYLVAVLIKDDNLNLDGMPQENAEVDLDKVMEKMEKLKKMREQDLINDDEFIKLKSDIMASAGISSLPQEEDNVKPKKETKTNSEQKEDLTEDIKVENNKENN